MTDAQSVAVKSFRDGLLNALRVYRTRYNALEIRTPFLGFAGEPLCIYVTASGEVTDGGSTLNLFRSLRCIDDFRAYPFREEFMHSHYICEEPNGELTCHDADPCHLLRYAQGLSLLLNKFEAHPISVSENLQMPAIFVIDD